MLFESFMLIWLKTLPPSINVKSQMFLLSSILETINIPADKTYTTIKGLKPDTHYVNKVAAINKYGAGSFSSSYVIKTDPPTATPPNPVSRIQPGSITPSSIQLSWPAPRFVSLHKVYLCGLNM